jgi:PPOX class probable F420-dependent enzyme
VKSRFAEARVARLATVRADGRPHIVPVCFVVVGETAWSAVDAKPKRTNDLVRLDNVRATGHATLLVDHWDEDWTQLWWVRAGGPARVVEDGSHEPAVIDALRAKYPQYATHALDGPLLAVELREWRTWSA